MDITISFEKYIPKPNIFYGYFEVLKRMKFIADVKVVMRNNEPIIKVFRNKKTEENTKNGNQSKGDNKNVYKTNLYN